MGTRRVNNYEVVKELPNRALNVLDYAISKGISKEAIYNQVRRGKNKDFKIVIFKGFNFVIPKD